MQITINPNTGITLKLTGTTQKLNISFSHLTNFDAYHENNQDILEIEYKKGEKPSKTLKFMTFQNKLIKEVIGELK